MSEPVTQREIDHETRNHLNLIEPLLERIGSGSASQVSAGYVEMDKDTDERFTDARVEYRDGVEDGGLEQHCPPVGGGG